METRSSTDAEQRYISAKLHGFEPSDAVEILLQGVLDNFHRGRGGPHFADVVLLRRQVTVVGSMEYVFARSKVAPHLLALRYYPSNDIWATTEWNSRFERVNLCWSDPDFFEQVQQLMVSYFERRDHEVSQSVACASW